MSTVRPPSTIEEYRRIAHAFLVGCKWTPGTKVYVVMSTVAPLYRIQGIFGDLAHAEAALAATRLEGFAWTGAELDSRGIFEVMVPESTGYNRLVVLDEGSTTESNTVNPDQQIPSALQAHLTFENIQKVQLAITVDDTVITYTLANDTTAVFLTQGAADAFLFSQYYAYFGPEYAAERRKRSLARR